MATSSSSSGGVSFLGLLFLVFLVLKLTGFITWSWWFVTMPLWAGAAVILALLALVGIGMGIAALVRPLLQARRARKNLDRNFRRINY